MKGRTKILLTVGVAVPLLAAGLFIRSRSSHEIEVTAEKAKKGPLRSIVTASGNIVPHKVVNISGNIMGEIKRIPVKEGDRVEKGDLLIVIDPQYYLAELRSEEAALASAEAQLALAKANFERADKIYSERPPDSGEGLISKEEHERLLSEYQVALSTHQREEALVESARANLEKTSIYSPITGVVTSLNVEEGEVAVTGTMNNPGTVLMTVSDLSRMQAEVDVDETDIVEVRLGQAAEITIDAYPDTIFHGTVSEIGNSPIISSLGTTGDEAVDFKVVIDLLDPPDNLKPGLSTTADIIAASRDSALYVPIQSLTVRSIPEDREEGASGHKAKAEKEGVFAVRDGQAIFSPVGTGISDGMNIEITSGLGVGDQVVTGSFQTIRTLKDSARVKVTERLREVAEESRQ